MTVVLADPARFVVDWNWQRHLTVWTLAGRHYEPQFDSKVLEYDLLDQSASQRQGARRRTPLVAGSRPHPGTRCTQRERQPAGH